MASGAPAPLCGPSSQTASRRRPAAPHATLSRMPAFNELSATFFDEYFRLDPVSATGIGDHRFDDRWPDLSSAGRAARIAFAERWIASLEAHAPGDLTADERADREVLLRTLEAIRFQDTELLDERWDPLTWVYLLGAGSSRCSPVSSRRWRSAWPSVAGRLEGFPAVVDAARDELVGAGDRPVSRFHTEIAIRAARRHRRAGRRGARGRRGGTRRAAARRHRTAPARGGRDRPSRPGRVRRISGTWSCRAPRGRAAWVRELFAAKLRHTLAVRPEPGRSWPGPSTITRWSAPRCSGSRASCGRPGCRRPADRGPGRTRRRRLETVRASSTRSPPSTRRRTSCSTTAATRSAGSRRSAATTTSSAWPTSRSRSAGRRSSCAPTAGRCSIRPVRSTRARRRSSASRRPRDWTPEQAESPTCARTTTGCSGS